MRIFEMECISGAPSGDISIIDITELKPENYIDFWKFINTEPYQFGEEHINIASALAGIFVGQQLFELFKIFLQKIDSEKLRLLKKNEQFLRALIELKMQENSYFDVYDLIKEGEFTDSANLIDIWDEAHYREKTSTQGQALTALEKFRIRKRNPPPASICPEGRQLQTVPVEARTTLKKWYNKHIDDPYPSKLKKQKLAVETGLTLKQVKTWFANTRRSHRRKLLSKKKDNKPKAETTGKQTSYRLPSISNWKFSDIGGHQALENPVPLAFDEIRQPIADSKCEAVDENLLKGSDDNQLKGADENQLKSANESLLKGADESLLKGADESLLKDADDNQLKGADDNQQKGADEIQLKGAVDEKQLKVDAENQLYVEIINDSITDVQGTEMEILNENITDTQTETDGYHSVNTCRMEYELETNTADNENLRKMNERNADRDSTDGVVSVSDHMIDEPTENRSDICKNKYESNYGGLNLPVIKDSAHLDREPSNHAETEDIVTSTTETVDDIAFNKDQTTILPTNTNIKTLLKHKLLNDKQESTKDAKFQRPSKCGCFNTAGQKDRSVRPVRSLGDSPKTGYESLTALSELCNRIEQDTLVPSRLPVPSLPQTSYSNSKKTCLKLNKLERLQKAWNDSFFSRFTMNDYSCEKVRRRYTAYKSNYRANLYAGIREMSDCRNPRGDRSFLDREAYPSHTWPAHSDSYRMMFPRIADEAEVQRHQVQDGYGETANDGYYTAENDQFYHHNYRWDSVYPRNTSFADTTPPQQKSVSSYHGFVSDVGSSCYDSSEYMYLPPDFSYSQYPHTATKPEGSEQFGCLDLSKLCSSSETENKNSVDDAVQGLLNLSSSQESDP